MKTWYFFRDKKIDRMVNIRLLQLMKPLGETSFLFVLCSSSLSYIHHSVYLLVSKKKFNFNSLSPSLFLFLFLSPSLLYWWGKNFTIHCMEIKLYRSKKKKKNACYSTIWSWRTVCRRTARLKFHLKIRTTPDWKNELRTVQQTQGTFAVETTSSAALPTSKRLHFSRFPGPACHACVCKIDSITWCTRCKLSYVNRRRIEK